MYYVITWDTNEILYEFEKLAIAKKYARGKGHTGEDHPFLTGYPPIARVTNEAGEVVYNPRFSKCISADVGGLINAQPAGHF